MIEDKCIICENKNNKILCVILSKGKIRDTYRIIKCKNCKLVHVIPKFDTSTYTKVYDFQYFNDGYITQKDKMINFFKKRFNEIEKLINGKKILDIGCGVGLFLKVAKDRGYEPYGIDISDEAVELAKKYFNLKLNLGELKENMFPSSYFDIITMWDVIEHMPSPQIILREIYKILKPEGLLIIKTPNFYTIYTQISLLRTKFDHKNRLHIPTHIYHFSKDTIRKILEVNNFKILKIKNIDEPISEYRNKLSIKSYLWKLIYCLSILLSQRESILVYATKK